MKPSADRRKGVRRKVVFALGICLLVISIYEGFILFQVVRLTRQNPATTAFIEKRSREAVAQGKAPQKWIVWIPFDRISPNLLRAVISAEDPRFWAHGGVDVGAMREALKEDWTARRLLRGGSTVDQQLAKNLFLSPSKNPLRKVQEIIVAVEMERFLGKKRILEIYLNVIEWGDGIYGAEAAAEHYFNCSASSLTLRQAAYLAAIIPGPRGVYNPVTYPGRVQHRSWLIMRRVQQSN
jgi:monofunctional biosynthetic peptidoglycan transglycosylase